ncbi:glutamate ABC transporter substrate-binding protein [Saccharothrix variisporea]|uniref:Polar amino acid transport system substrate-binding protein n=1 Tax=Saccharothrix variisporea TaxID=543527 RepID=A0A495XR64_9PSEU|nr:glutamate ABC transporter substrate-binding protein [Saccharothrix variisporea]RKT74953.1 polar amino acid transport system substrate-binding protein [Saccharothrix variisporea]
MKRLALVALLAVAGCATPEAAPPRAPFSVPVPAPVGVSDPAPIPEEGKNDCQAELSFRPDGPLPPPGAPPAGSTMAEIGKRKLVVGVGSNAYLLGYRDPRDGRMLGFETAIVEEVAFAIFGGDRARIAERIQYRSLNADERIPALVAEENPVDIVLAGMTMTCERWAQVNFSSAYYSSRQRLLVHRSSGVRSIDDLGGKKVCASNGSTNLRPVAQAASHPVPVGAANTSDCLLLLQQGQVDAVSTGDIILAGLAAQDPATQIVGPSLRSDPTGIAIAKPRLDLVRFVNAVLEKMIADGTWKRLQGDWLATHIGEADPPTPRYRSE